ncbi:hypothetical protein GCM10007092_01120 [Thermus composti]|uniref:Uncharacterized protein n=1 Tax=Thermus composti TaxID=532059 RepID=A0ABV6PZG8_9DEIN|nr:hypothetical protein [Thermus composti]GGM91952.1 hypothetical protein GCM10007092_01120 [Thermus composti]
MGEGLFCAGCGRAYGAFGGFPDLRAYRERPLTWNEFQDPGRADRED